MRICNLASGSSGNCTLIESENTRVLVDAGKPFAYIFNTLNEIGVDIATIDAILVTHEHIDHIKSVAKIARSYNIKVYAHVNIQEIMFSQVHIDKSLFYFFDTDFYIGDLHIVPIPVPHDSKYCVAFRIEEGNAVMSICTDIGSVTEESFELMKSSALVYLEANYDEEMLMAYPGYPPFLKRRINSIHGHLSNIDCAKAIEKLARTGTRLVSLAHISEHSNSHNLAVSTVANYLESKGISPNVNIKLDLTYQDHRGTIFRINPT